MLLGLCFVDLAHDLLLLQVLDLLLLADELFAKFLGPLTVFKLCILQVRLILLAELLLELLQCAFMLSAQFVHLLALSDELRAELILQLSVNLILLSHLVKNLTQVAPTEAEKLSKLVLARCISCASCIKRGS